MFGMPKLNKELSISLFLGELGCYLVSSSSNRPKGTRADSFYLMMFRYNPKYVDQFTRVIFKQLNIFRINPRIKNLIVFADREWFRAIFLYLRLFKHL